MGGWRPKSANVVRVRGGTVEGLASASAWASTLRPMNRTWVKPCHALRQTLWRQKLVKVGGKDFMSHVVARLA